MSDRDRVPVRVLWVIKGLGPGGAERLLVSAAAASTADDISYEVAYLLPEKDHLVPEFEAAGVPVHALDAPRPLDPRWIGRLGQLIKRREIDIVHVHSPLVAGPARIVARARRHRPALVYTEHNTWASYDWSTRMLNAATYFLDDADVAVSEEAANSMPARWRRRTDVVVHGVPIDEVRSHLVNRDRVRAELGVGPDDVLVMTVANYREKKDYPTLLRAAREVLDASTPVRFRFAAAGQGPLQTEVESEHARLGLGDEFKLLGYRPDATDLLAAADIFTLSSIHEGYPVTLMEALALGLPVVATAVGGIPEAVRDGREGVLVPPSRPARLAAAIVEVGTDRERRRSMSENAAVRGRSYDIRRAVERLEAAYRNLAGRGE